MIKFVFEFSVDTSDSINPAKIDIIDINKIFEKNDFIDTLLMKLPLAFLRY